MLLTAAKLLAVAGLAAAAAVRVALVHGCTAK
jgi:hypothetical protein